MKNILVFGASGDTGKYFVNYFLDHYSGKEYKLIALGTKNISYFSDIGIEYHQIDIRKKEQFKNLPKDVFGVIHLAGMMPARMKGYDPQKYIDVNITGTLNILEFCRENKVDRILFAQSFGDIKDYAENNIRLSLIYQENLVLLLIILYM